MVAESTSMVVLFKSSPKDMHDMLFFFFFEREEERETLIGCLANTPQSGIDPATQARALKLNPQPSGVWDDTRSTEPPGQGFREVFITRPCL